MNETISNIFKLKTTRSNNFSDDKIPDNLFEAVLKACVKAPNASNRQSYSIIVLGDEEKQKLRLKGDKVLLFIVDFYRHECLKEHLGKNVSFNHFQPFLTGVIDVSLAIQNAVIAANSLEIGFLITNDTYTKDLSVIFDLFKLPLKGCFPLLYLCLGYPKDKNIKHKSRLDNTHIVHYGSYKDYTLDETASMVQEYDNEALELFTNWKEKGYTTYLDWFYDKWTPTLEDKEKSQKLLQFIKSAGFLDS